MRWEALLADLEAQFDAAEAAELAEEVSERTRIEVARLPLGDRLRASVGRELVVVVGGPAFGEAVRGRLSAVGADWLLVTEQGRREALLPFAAVTTVRGLAAASTPPSGPVEPSLGLRYALRALARDRAVVRLTLTGTALTGTVVRAGADYLELAEHPLDRTARAAAVAAYTAVPYAAIVVVRSA